MVSAYGTLIVTNLTYHMVCVAQLGRASDCGSEGREFESHHAPKITNTIKS